MKPAAELSQRLSIAMTNAGISAADLAKAANVAHKSVYNWQNGKHAPGNAKIKQLAEILNVTPTWLAFGEL